MGPERLVIKCHSTCRRLESLPGITRAKRTAKKRWRLRTPRLDAENAPLPGKKKNLAAGDAENSEDEARAGNGNGALNTGKPGEPETDSRGSAHRGEGMPNAMSVHQTEYRRTETARTV